mgnify:CR=1 FL=1
MAWLIKFDDKAKKDLSALDKAMAKRITAYLRDRVSTLDDPRSIGEALKGSKLGAFGNIELATTVSLPASRTAPYASSSCASATVGRCTEDECCPETLSF